ncbi:MAG: DUF362 domain-containing protein [bacterium]
MKRLLIILAAVLAFGVYASEVYFTSDISPEGVMRVYEEISDNVKGDVAVKLHFGEAGNDYYLKPYLVRDLMEAVGGTFVETNVLYTSPRQKTLSHIKLAKEHGFDFAPIDILDSSGIDTLYMDDLQYFSEFYIGRHMNRYDTYIIYSHFKGHKSAGFGGAVKNVAMGLGTASGKRDMHNSFIPQYNPEKCNQCGKCAVNCPVDAINPETFEIDYSKCTGCGQCITECAQDAMTAPDNVKRQQVFLEHLVEYAFAISSRYDMVYINVLANITPACDCARNPGSPFIEDIGILASTDIVALDKASLDMVNEMYETEDAFLKINNVSGNRQLEYAESLGMGSTQYTIIDLDSQ